MRYLLDVNVLIGSAFSNHSSHRAAHSWFHRDEDRLWATCPLTQAGFVRISSRELADSLGISRKDALRTALASLDLQSRSPHHEFWPLDIDLLDLSHSQRSRLIGSGQIADMQLLMLAHRHRGQLATFDTGIRELAAGTRYSDSLLIL